MLNKRVLACIFTCILSASLLSGCGAIEWLSDKYLGNNASTRESENSVIEENEAEDQKPEGTFEIQRHTDGSVKLNYFSQKNISSVDYIIYSEIGGKDDKVIYNAEYDGAAWTVDLSNDDHRRSGNYHVEVYINGSQIGETSFNFPLRLNKTEIVLEKDALKNGDAKFFNGKILTSVKKCFSLMDLECNEQRRYENIKVDWFNVLEDENLIVYSNSSKNNGIIQMDENDDVVFMTTICEGKNLMIDPTIAKCKDVYYATFTEIIGKWNNGSADKKNGEYILHLYRSENLKDWEYITDIVDEFYNIEDVDMYALDGSLIAIYEKEELDKGDSAIYLTISEDEGITWSEPRELVTADADHEPATLERYGENFYLFYSSDAEVPGMSYEGASAYYSVFDNEFNCLVKDVKIETETQEGILFYDCAKIEGSYYMIFATDYVNKRNLVLEKVIE